MNTSLSKLASVASIALILGVAPWFATSAQAQKVLRWKMQPGEVMRVQFSQDMGLETSFQNQPVQTSAEMAMLMKWEVQKVSPQGVIETKQTIERVKMSMASPGTPSVEYDSASPGKLEGVAKTLADNIQPLVGVEFLQQMDARGDVLDVRLTESGQKKLASTPGGGEISEMFSKDGLRSLLAQAATVLPQEAIKPGQQWTGVSETKSPVGTLKMNNTYTYRGTEVRNGRSLERIDVAVDVTFDKVENAVGLQVNVTDQNNSGVMYFDASAGRFVDSLLHQKMTLSTMVGQQVYQQKLDTKLRMILSPVAPAARTATAPKSAPTTVR